MSSSSLWSLPSGVEPWSAKDQNSFAYQSTVKRWPAILTQVIDAVYQASDALTYSRTPQDHRIDEGKAIIEKVSGLKHDMGRDRPLQPIEADGGPDLSLYNELVEKEKPTWFSASWLFAECYMYRLLRSYFALSKHWQNFDPFSKSKLQTFKSSGAGITALAESLDGLLKGAQSDDAESQKVIWREIAQTALWGNATDLSLLTSLSYADIQALQTTGKAQQEERARFILTGLGDLDKAWEKIAAMKDGRVDIVLDNSGFELVTDLYMADWLLATGHVKEVVFHPKNIPWFVSDVCAPDFRHTLESLLEPNFFSGAGGDGDASWDVSAPAARQRSVSRSRQARADPSFFESGETIPHPAGTRSLKMSEEDLRGREKSPVPVGSRRLQAREGSTDGTGEHPRGYNSLKLDPAYFKNARSRTISPTRSYVMDSSTFSSLSIHDEDGIGAAEGQRNSGFRSAPPAAASSGAASNAERSPERGRGRSAASESHSAVQRMAARWNSHLSSGAFRLSIAPSSRLGSSGKADFWTTPLPYSALGAGADPELLKDLQASKLVIFKGDLNYRKLVADARWEATTPFTTAIGDLKGKLDLLTLRTCKADVCVGLGEGVEKKVQAEDKDWRVDGKWAVVQFSQKE